MNLTIKDSSPSKGKLVLIAAGNSSHGIELSAGEVTIKNAELSIQSANCGINGSYGIIIDDSNVIVNSDAICFNLGNGDVVIKNNSFVSVTSANQNGMFCYDTIKISKNSQVYASGKWAALKASDGIFFEDDNTTLTDFLVSASKNTQINQLTESGLISEKLVQEGQGYSSYYFSVRQNGNYAYTVYYKLASPINAEEELYENPEVDILVDDVVKTVYYGNKTTVINKKLPKFEADKVKVDYSEANAELDTVILKNEVVKQINDIEYINKYGKVFIDDVDNTIPYSVRVTLGEGCATYLQKRAMNGKVVAEVKYGCTANGKTLDTDAKIYVPCDSANARVFYLIDANTIGTLNCKVENGYCVFNRYMDGTYVVVE